MAETTHSHDSHEECRRWLGALSDYVDGDLAEDVCQVIEQHMASCERCRIVVDTLRKTVELYHATAAEDTPGLTSDMRQRLFFRLELGEFQEKQP